VIPKVIHYCWFGNGEMPALAKRCIASWKRILADYEIKLWNEQNFDVHVSQFSREAYDHQMYAFVSDYVRLWALRNYGGIYLDIDVEAVKQFDDLLNYRVVLGADDGGCILSAFMAAEPGHPFIEDALALYNQRRFAREDGGLEITPNTIVLQSILKNYGWVSTNTEQHLKQDIVLFPDDYFQPKSLITGACKITGNTYAIHHHTLLWVSKRVLLVKFLRQNILVPLLGKSNYMKLTRRIRRMFTNRTSSDCDRFV